jgi:tRNA (cmo5U34)-methyltransferase
MTKSTVEQIRQRFDKDVERFSNLETGQSATIDAPLVLDLIAKAATAANPAAKRLLDIGCGAGNYTLKLLQSLPLSEITLIDLSQPMLERARQRISAVTPAQLNLHHLDIREFACGEQQYDVVVAAAVLHHLRSDEEWRAVFGKIHRSLKPGGSFWVSDLVHHSNPAVQAMMWERYGDYLAQLKGESYREQVFAYIEQEDSPRPLLFQLDLLREAGFQEIEVLHKNSCFAAFGAIKKERWHH